MTEEQLLRLESSIIYGALINKQRFSYNHGLADFYDYDEKSKLDSLMKLSVEKVMTKNEYIRSKLKLDTVWCGDLVVVDISGEVKRIYLSKYNKNSPNYYNIDEGNKYVTTQSGRIETYYEEITFDNTLAKELLGKKVGDIFETVDSSDAKNILTVEVLSIEKTINSVLLSEKELEADNKTYLAR